MSGAFITVEGGDGSGKTTHIAFLAEQLVGGGVEVVCTREPGGTELGAKLREILLAGDGAAVAVDAELLLFFADRAQHIAEVIRPALAGGKMGVIRPLHRRDLRLPRRRTRLAARPHRHAGNLDARRLCSRI